MVPPSPKGEGGEAGKLAEPKIHAGDFVRPGELSPLAKGRVHASLRIGGRPYDDQGQPGTGHFHVAPGGTVGWFLLSLGLYL